MPCLPDRLPVLDVCVPGLDLVLRLRECAVFSDQHRPGNEGEKRRRSVLVELRRNHRHDWHDDHIGEQHVEDEIVVQLRR